MRFLAASESSDFPPPMRAALNSNDLVALKAVQASAGALQTVTKGLSAQTGFLCWLSLALSSCCAPTAAPESISSEPQIFEAHRTVPGQSVRVVRFNVKPAAREEFERFFWESLKPAAAKRQGVAVEELDLGSFNLLIPAEANPQGNFTYYVLVDSAGKSVGSGEVMRDMVREAFPGDDGQERVRRWMQSMVLVEPFAPVGENFVAADLRASRPPRRTKDFRD